MSSNPEGLGQKHALHIHMFGSIFYIENLIIPLTCSVGGPESSVFHLIPE